MAIQIKLAMLKVQFIKAETALDGIGIEVHPGAQKYFDEVNNNCKGLCC